MTSSTTYEVHAETVGGWRAVKTGLDSLEEAVAWWEKYDTATSAKRKHRILKVTRTVIRED